MSKAKLWEGAAFRGLHRIIKVARLRYNAARWTRSDRDVALLYRRFVGPGDLCFDVGANIGLRTKVLLKLGCTVVAVEPQPTCADALRLGYGNNRKFSLIEKALGAGTGYAEIAISSQHVISSLSPEWREAVVKSGRFDENSWEHTTRVAVTTLDCLIAEFGLPRFIKIDVEGYEYQVLQGLSLPVPFLSFEFVPEFIEAAQLCIAHLANLGPVRFNYSMHETMTLALDRWVGQREMQDILLTSVVEGGTWGDIYATFTGSTSTGL